MSVEDDKLASFNPRDYGSTKRTLETLKETVKGPIPEPLQ